MVDDSCPVCQLEPRMFLTTHEAQQDPVPGILVVVASFRNGLCHVSHVYMSHSYVESTSLLLSLNGDSCFV